jgi:uncharacterized RDD family membrane protein YckC
VSAAPSPAGFWKRYVAYFLDALLVLAVSQGALSLVFALAGRESGDLVWSLWRSLVAPGATLPDLPAAIAMLRELLPELLWLGAVSTVAYASVAVPYALWFENSPKHATPGKQAVGLRVTARDRGPPTRGQVMARVLAAGLSWLTLNLGHALAGWTRERRALHDYLAGTRVENVDPARAAMPAWGWAIIALNAAFLLAVMGMSVVLGWLLAQQVPV